MCYSCVGNKAMEEEMTEKVAKTQALNSYRHPVRERKGSICHNFVTSLATFLTFQAMSL